EAAREIEPDDRPLAAKRAAFGAAERAVAARQLGPRCNAIAGLKARHAAPDFEDAGAELVPEELNRRLGFQPALDAIIGERRDPLGELRLRDAGLHAERLRKDILRAANRPREGPQP